MLTVLYGGTDSEKECAAWMTANFVDWGLASNSRRLPDNTPSADIALHIALLMLEGSNQVVVTLSNSTPALLLNYLVDIIERVNKPSLPNRLIPVLSEDCRLSKLTELYIPVITGSTQDAALLRNALTGLRQRVELPKPR